MMRLPKSFLISPQMTCCEGEALQVITLGVDLAGEMTFKKGQMGKLNFLKGMQTHV
jgi:hypothetical protein